jgi:leucine dehydrogenase
MVQTHASSACPPEHLELLEDSESGLRGVIAIHSTTLGPAAGGCRFWSYANDTAAMRDALRLAEGMSYKNAIAGLPLGGGKAVLQVPRGNFDRFELFRAFGRAVANLGGHYVTAEDVGTTVADMVAVRSETRHVAGLPHLPDRPSGDPSPWTARGVFLGIEVAAKVHLGAALADLTIAVQGLGNVGLALCELLHESGAKLIVADPRSDRVAAAANRFGAFVMSTGAILQAKADVVSPCALGGVLDAHAIGRLYARVVCGGANNQLHVPEDGERLADAGVLYAPDYVVNAGGIINVAAEYLGWTQMEVEARVDDIPHRLARLIHAARTDGVAMNRAADSMARRLIASPNVTTTSSLAAA